MLIHAVGLGSNKGLMPILRDGFLRPGRVTGITNEKAVFMAFSKYGYPPEDPIPYASLTLKPELLRRGRFEIDKGWGDQGMIADCDGRTMSASEIDALGLSVEGKSHQVVVYQDAIPLNKYLCHVLLDTVDEREQREVIKYLQKHYPWVSIWWRGNHIGSPPTLVTEIQL